MRLKVSKEFLAIFSFILLLATISAYFVFKTPIDPVHILIESPPELISENIPYNFSNKIITVSLSDVFEKILYQRLFRVLDENVSLGVLPLLSIPGNLTFSEAIFTIISKNTSEVSPIAYYAALSYYPAIKSAWEYLLGLTNFKSVCEQEYFLDLIGGERIIIKLKDYSFDFLNFTETPYPPTITNLSLKIENVSTEYYIKNIVESVNITNNTVIIERNEYYWAKVNISFEISIKTSFGINPIFFKITYENNSISDRLKNNTALEQIKFEYNVMEPEILYNKSVIVEIFDFISNPLRNKSKRSSIANITLSLLSKSYITYENVNMSYDISQNLTYINITRKYYPADLLIEFNISKSGPSEKEVLEARNRFFNPEKSIILLKNLYISCISDKIWSLSKNSFEYSFYVAQLMSQTKEGSSQDLYAALITREGPRAKLASYITSFHLYVFNNDEFTYFVLIEDNREIIEFIMKNTPYAKVYNEFSVLLLYDSRIPSFPASFLFFENDSYVQLSLFPKPIVESLDVDFSLRFSDYGPKIPVYFLPFPKLEIIDIPPKWIYVEYYRINSRIGQ